MPRSVRLITNVTHGETIDVEVSVAANTSVFAMVSRIPLFASLQQTIEHLEPALLAAGATFVRVVLVQDDVDFYAVLVRCASKACAEALVAQLHGVPGPSSLSSDVLCAATVSEAVSPMMTQPLTAHRPKGRPGGSPLLLPDAQHLAQCTICLDLMGGGSDILFNTICGHSFHLNCIARCQAGEPCPLCRFDMLLVNCATKCATCSTTQDLWMCLVCGDVNCGRSARHHGEAHFERTQHTHVVQLGGCRVWDYTADAFVHRLAIPEDGGPPAAPKAQRWCDDDEELDYAVLQSKIDVVADYYTKLMTSQLVQQQQYFESLIVCTATSTLVHVEATQRIALAHQWSGAFRAALTQFRWAMTALTKALRRQRTDVAHRRSFLQTTTDSVQVGNEKLRQRIADMRHAERSGVASKSIEALTAELSELCEQLS